MSSSSKESTVRLSICKNGDSPKQAKVVVAERDFAQLLSLCKNKLRTKANRIFNLSEDGKEIINTPESLNSISENDILCFSQDKDLIKIKTVKQKKHTTEAAEPNSSSTTTTSTSSAVASSSSTATTTTTRKLVDIDLNVTCKPEQRVIQFYSTVKPYGEFSNFWRKTIYIGGKEWPTSEHYFQAKKFEGTKYEELVRTCATPGDSAKQGRRRDLPLRADWEEVKVTIMYEACYAKFSQNKQLRELLLGTGDAFLVEHTANDWDWGDGADAEPIGSGNNKLGIILMKVREDIRQGVASLQ